MRPIFLLFISMLFILLVLTPGDIGKVQSATYGEAAPSYGKADTDIERGRALFNDTTLGKGISGKSCSSCHPGGRGVEAAGNKKEFNIMGQKQNSLEEAVNFCIEMALKGTAIDTASREMKDITAYMKSLSK